MRHQHSSLVLAGTLDNLLKNFLSDVSIKRWDRVIHQHNLRVGVDSPCQADSCFLATGQIDTLLPYLSQITRRQNLQISNQLASFDRLRVSSLIKWSPKADIVPNRHILDPWLLLHERYTAAQLDRSFIQTFIQDLFS